MEGGGDCGGGVVGACDPVSSALSCTILDSMHWRLPALVSRGRVCLSRLALRPQARSPPAGPPP